MLKPALSYKDELLSLFSKELYSYDYFLFSGVFSDGCLPTIEPRDDGRHDWAIVDKEKVIGYFSYFVNAANDSVCDFGVYSFDKNNPVIGYSVFKKMEELVKNYHRVEWKMIEGNPVEKHYDKFLERHVGQKLTLKDVYKIFGKYKDCYIYEIINNG